MPKLRVSEDMVFERHENKYRIRVPLTLAEARRYLNVGSLPDTTGQILEEIDWFIKFYKVSAKVLLFYERIAFYGKEDNSLCITFDSNIRFRTEKPDLLQDESCILLLEPWERIKEIKIAAAFPLWLMRLLAELKIYPTSFSKYGTAYCTFKGGKNQC